MKNEQKIGTVMKLLIALEALLLLLALIGPAAADIPEQKPPEETTQTVPLDDILSDYNKNGIDDYTDMLDGARADVESITEYDTGYYQGGFPPAGKGVCTDVIWRGFKAAGYNLKEMVDKDIRDNPGAYPNIQNRDPDIDFRHVTTIDNYFKKNSLTLTTDPLLTDEWQPGDIVVYAGHIAFISDRLNREGQPWIIHNGGDGKLGEQDALLNDEITAHYRFDPALLEPDQIIPWEEPE